MVIIWALLFALSEISSPPSVLLLPAPGQLRLFNQGSDDLKLRGVDLIAPGTMPDIGGEPRIIPKGTYFYFHTEGLKAKALSLIGRNGQSLFPFDIYLSDAKERHYVAKFDLLITMHDGEMTVDTQQLGVFLSDETTRSK